MVNHYLLFDKLEKECIKRNFFGSEFYQSLGAPRLFIFIHKAIDTHNIVTHSCSAVFSCSVKNQQPTKWPVEAEK
ncbi:MAG: hypothetical protein A3B99_01885 [Candidatus Yanofskybacteria bacterium RIFCSPHIGHO2_02_FULL_44_12b]|uniref:Uncharacterized protein n=1 Tax=Candidatus Yanofskybacteria bacterium RIFCSPLOWO2_01_FULL_44_22 TaxID=1802697 RepID=A0A1F8GPS1_9BACT|nr:MAG: hypothetical protein A2659_05065 [Candidatus Yanofskybacteria bacterium RIFCSPHIGHO2_01_FULL_44_24]OGN14990.1 MAG: hypothetical protein A3B99_01885 [Candidatus Yanofskybacteria bacterium RIFCSPHIGHO2_02_FULL_44_12b]OGN26429.1 MAG: hypothetical protein A2925_03595 [Candidatus Yanofskybacteria bacterium RIFCSPLOWO2_01_FULL_44_22]